MDENTDNEEQKPEYQPPKEPKESKGKNSLWYWLLAAVIVLLLAGAGYLWMQLQASKDKEQQLNKDKQQLQEQVDKLKKADAAGISEADAEPACSYTASASMKANIKAALDTKNTAVFETYVTDPVKYVLAASEYGGDVSATEAAKSIEYTHSATGPWDFNLPQATLDAYDAGDYGAHFDDNSYVGKAASGMLVSFGFNCDGSKINKIFVAADGEL